ncbi:hypothetical protein BT96DRAFT_838225 [Gymnopus androsaceus JB14]|uniref:DNA helicase Pif1-like 2B domain-containing protein n=1 Tax=Gymnopus androsaceus JB14 TaxID=1447944 RepID=A0A6A4GNY8_9AGAR|nr:hypothetical protein BT96DRAFT_838225 [Gymnopus androsaceus JB14]
MEGVDNVDFQYSVEYLNSINATGLPISHLKLKIGAPLMILRNLDPTPVQEFAMAHGQSLFDAVNEYWKFRYWEVIMQVKLRLFHVLH